MSSSSYVNYSIYMYSRFVDMLLLSKKRGKAGVLQESWILDLDEQKIPLFLALGFLLYLSFLINYQN